MCTPLRCAYPRSPSPHSVVLSIPNCLKVAQQVSARTPLFAFHPCLIARLVFLRVDDISDRRDWPALKSSAKLVNRVGR